MSFEQTMENIALGFEVVGVAIIVIGGVLALVAGVKNFSELDRFFLDVRRSFGILVAVRIALSFSLDVEVEGIAPWRRLEAEEKLKAQGESDEDAASP